MRMDMRYDIMITRKSFEKGTKSMTIRYNRLWKLLVDKKMSKADLRKAVGMAPNTLTKLRKDEPVSLEVLVRICEFLRCDIGDVVEIVEEEATR